MPELIFTIEAAKADRAQKWVRAHLCKLRKKPDRTAIGGKITYSFTDTSIGQIQVVKCACGDKHLISDDL